MRAPGPEIEAPLSTGETKSIINTYLYFQHCSWCLLRQCYCSAPLTRPTRSSSCGGRQNQWTRDRDHRPVSPRQCYCSMPLTRPTRSSSCGGRQNQWTRDRDHRPVSPRQATHLPLVWDRYFPRHKHQIEGIYGIQCLCVLDYGDT